VLREEAERGTECGALGLVAHVAVARLPRHKRALRLGETEETTPVLLPLGSEVCLLDRRESGFLRRVIRSEPALLVAVPAPGGALDAGPVEDTQVRCETLEVLRTWVLCRDPMLRRGPPGLR
jgi:hypothetical protein